MDDMEEILDGSQSPYKGFNSKTYVREMPAYDTSQSPYKGFNSALVAIIGYIWTSQSPYKGFNRNFQSADLTGAFLVSIPL